MLQTTFDNDIMQAPSCRFVRALGTVATRCRLRPSTDQIGYAISTGARRHGVNRPLRPSGGLQWLSTAANGSQSFIHVVRALRDHAPCSESTNVGIRDKSLCPSPHDHTFVITRAHNCAQLHRHAVDGRHVILFV